MKKTKKTAAKKSAPGGKARLKKATKLSEKDLKKVSGGSGRKGVADDGV